ncbi:hypothetical protein CL684_01925 [Candidatus Campbellbacteria bacterium]|nr:hypothetical protein [Candidatus Campbellbacteria bacterium]|tara:strand:+ start:1455 stop:1847 length:393 start_codon:yes stop_codon:yes gene_type:complete
MKKLSISDQEILIIQNYVEEIRKIKLIQIDAKSLEERAKSFPKLAKDMISKQKQISLKLRKKAFNELKREFQDILANLKEQVVENRLVQKYPSIIEYTYAEGAEMAYRDLQKILTELEIKEIAAKKRKTA